MIRVRLFAMLREQAGTDLVEIPLPVPATLGEAVKELARRHPRLAPALRERRVLLAVNQVYASPETRLADGDEVAVLPPVSGG